MFILKRSSSHTFFWFLSLSLCRWGIYCVLADLSTLEIYIGGLKVLTDHINYDSSHHMDTTPILYNIRLL